MTGAVLDIRDLTVRYPRGAAPAVENLSLRVGVGVGEIVAIVGESGSGKSTTAAAALGLLPTGSRASGSIRVAGDEVVGASDRVLRGIRGRVVGLVPQDPMVGLNPTLRIGAQVAEAVAQRGVPRALRGSQVLEALAHAGVDDPELRAAQYPHELSGGLRQRVLIAIALAGHPRLIIADEPTSALDVTVQKRILDHLESLVRTDGLSLLLITHDLAVAADRADRVLVMRGGRLVEEGGPERILVSPREDYTRELIAAAPGFHGAPVRRPLVDAPEILRIESVTKDFELPHGRGAFRALDDVTLSVRRGQTLAVVGESGSGKTTASRVALGLERATSGRVIVEGRDLTDAGWREWRPVRRRIQLVHQNPFAALDPRFSVQDSIVEPLVSFGVGSRASRFERASELIELVGLPQDFLSRLPAELSGGQRQRVAIARALALEPDLVVLDEPVSALDVSVQAQILDLLARLQRELGVAYLVISHDLSVVAQISDHVAVLRDGHLAEAGATADVFAHPQSDETRALLDAVPGRRLGAVA